MELYYIRFLIVLTLAASSVLSEVPNISDSTGNSCRACSNNSPDKVKLSSNLSTLKLVQVVHRHGDRNRIDNHFPNSLNKDARIGSNGRGELTSVGETQGYELGRYLRARYDGYLSSVYTPSEIHVESSSRRRCRQTARKVLDGLFPVNDGSENEWNPSLRGQRIPIETLSPDNDNKLLMMFKCPKYDQLKQEYDASSDVQNFDAKMESFYEFLKHKTGLPAVNMWAAAGVMDTLTVEKSHGLDLPDWTENSEFWQAGYNTTLMHWKIRGGRQHSLMQKLMFGPLLSEIIINMELRRSDDVEIDLPKFLQFSAHDSTLTALMNAVGIDPPKPPPYASALIIELHKSNQEPNQYFVQILYRNDTTVPAHQLEIPKCGTVCDLDTFIHINSALLISQNEWHDQCHNI